MKHKYRVRLTLLLNAYVEVEASTPGEAEDMAFDKVAGLGKNADCWTDDGDVQVEDDTMMLVDGWWESVGRIPVGRGGAGVPTVEDTVDSAHGDMV